MDRYSLYAAQLLSFNEYFVPKGHSACQGCGVALAIRHLYKALDGRAPHLQKAPWQIPWDQTAIFCRSSSGSTSQPALLSIAKEKSSKGSMLYVCFDNESSEARIAEDILIKHMPAIAAASGYGYVATASPSHPFDLIEKIRRGWAAEGSSYVHVLCACPVGWGFDPQNTVRINRMAVETRLFPLYEIVGGYCRLTVEEPHVRPLIHYIKAQQRFAAWKSARIEQLQNEINTAFNALRDKASLA